MAQQFYQRPDYRRDDDNHNVYDDTPNSNGQRTPDNTDDVPRDSESGTAQKISNGAEDAERTSLFNQDGDTKKSGINSLSDMAGVGSSAIGATLGNTTTGRLAKLGAALWSTNRRKAITIGGGGLSGILVAGGALFITSLAPLRINSFVQNWQDKAFATNESAVEKESDTLFQHYLVRKVIPGMANSSICNSTRINKSCATKSDANNPIGALFNTWRDANLEGKLASKYGIEIQKNGNQFFIRTDNLQHRIFLGDYTPSGTADFDNKAFSRMNRSDIRREMRNAFQNETRLKQMMYRFSVGGLLERKYGIRRCIFACDRRDARTDRIEARRNAFKSILNERVILPRSEMYSLAFDCAMSSFSCTQGDEVDNNGTHTSQFERDLQARLADYKLRVGDKSLDELYNNAEEIRKQGISKFLLGKLIGEIPAKFAAKTLPVIGWIDLGANVVNALQNAGPALAKLNYVTYAHTAISTYMIYRTTADEVKAGKTDTVALGSVADSLNADPKADQGGLGAEQTPLYQSTFGANRKTVALSVIPTANALATKPEPLCNNGEKMDPGEVVCPELKVGAKSTVGKLASKTSDIANLPMFKVIGMTADFWNGTVGAILKYIGGAVGDAANALYRAVAPAWIEDKVADIAKSIVETVMGYLIVNPFSDNTSGGRNGDIATGGAYFLASDHSHSVLGGKTLSDAEVAQIVSEQQAETNESFANQSLFARIFGTDSQYSFVSRLAVALPSGFNNMASSIAATFSSNPLGHLFDSFGMLFASPGANAFAGANAFDIPMAGYTDEDLRNIGDPEAYWTTHCTDLAANNIAWGNAAIENKDTGMFENHTTNPCLLLKDIVGDAGGMFNTDLLPSSDGSSASPISSSGSGTIDQATVFQDSTDIPCATGTKDLGIQDGYHDGTKVPIRICAVTGMKSSSGESHDQYGVIGADGDTVVNSRVSANVLAMFKAAKADGVVLSADSSFRTMSHQQSLCPCDGRSAAKPGYSNHQMGLAIDFSEPSVVNTSAQTCSTRVKDESSKQWKWLDENAARYGFKQYSAESWHWDVLDSANRCGGGDG